MGANNDIVFRVRAEDAGMMRTFLAGAEALRATGRGADQAKAKFRALGDEGEKAGRRTKDAMGEAGRTINVTLGSATQEMGKLGAQFVGFGSVMAGLHTTVRMMTAEYERYKELSGQALGDVGGYSKKLEALQLQLPPGEKIATYEPEILKTLGRAGVPIAQVDNALGALEEIWSSSGNKPSGRPVTPREGLEVWKRSLQIFSPQGDFEGARLMGPGLMAAYRTAENGNIDEMTGRVMSMFGASQTTTMGKFGRHTLPGIAQVMNEFGVDLETAGAMSSALGQEMVDLTGRVTRNAQTVTLQRMDELASSSKMFNAKQLVAFKALNGWEKVEWISGDAKYADDAEKRRADKLRAYMLGGRTGGRNPSEQDKKDIAMALSRDGINGWSARGALQEEAKAESGIVSMLSASDPLGIRAKVRQRRDESRGQTPDEARRRGAEFFEGGKTSIATLRRTQMAVEGAETELRLSQSERAWRGLAMQSANVAMDATGKTAFGKRIESIVAGFDASKYSDSKAIEMIQDQLLEAEHNILERQPGDQWKFLRDPNAFYAEQYKKLPGPARKRVESLRATRRRLESLQLRAPSADAPGERSESDGTSLLNPAAPAPATNDQSSATRELTNELAATRAEIAKLASSAAQVRGAQVSVTIDDGGAQAARRLLDRPHPMTSLYG